MNDKLISHNTVEILLKQLDFTEKQTQIYLTLLKFGQLSPQEISSHSKINRSTVYAVCEDLVSKGVIKEDMAGSSKIYLAMPPIELQKLFQKEEKLLQLKKAKINSAIAELEKIAKDTKYTIPKINFIPEEEISDYLKARSEQWDKSVTSYDGVWWGFQDASFATEYHEWIDWYWSSASPGLRLKMLSNLNPTESAIKDKYHKRELKYLTEEHNFATSIWVLGDFIVIIQTAKKPFYLYEIHEAELARSQRYMFKKLWNDN